MSTIGRVKLYANNTIAGVIEIDKDFLNQIASELEALQKENENLSNELALRIGDKMEIATLRTQNQELREMCKVKDRALLKSVGLKPEP